MNDNFINLRDREAADFALTPIYRNGPLFECEVREYSFNGLPDQKTRSNVWKMLLRSYPYQPEIRYKKQITYGCYQHRKSEQRQKHGQWS